MAGIMYGFETEPQMVSVDLMQLQKTYANAGEGQVVTLKLGKDEHPVLIKDMGFDPRFEEPSHVDFWRIDLAKEVEAPVPVEFIGVSAAMKDEGGTLVRVLTEINVKALPSALPKQFTVDISALATFEDSIGIKDLDVPEGVTILNDENETITTVEAPRTEEEMEALEGAVEGDVTDIEGVEKEGEEGEEGAEGEDGEKKEGEEGAEGESEEGGEEKKEEGGDGE